MSVAILRVPPPPPPPHVDVWSRPVCNDTLPKCFHKVFAQQKSVDMRIFRLASLVVSEVGRVLFCTVKAR